MPIDCSIEPEVQALADRVRAFVRDVVIPVEVERNGSVHDAPEQLRLDLQARAREAGLLAPHVGKRWGGLGLDIRGQSVVFEEAGYSLLGPMALNVSAPDEGNMHLLEKVANEAQHARYLAPLAAGTVRSCFAMTEPTPGAGSDPTRLTTRAVRVDGGWRIDGHKWFITGANGAAFMLCMARTSGEPGDPSGGATIFFVDADNPGVRRVRDIETIDHGLFGGHSELVFENCIVSDDAVLGEVDRGFDHAQVRLGPARLTHCMRWLGVARRAHDIAIRYVADRPAFGQRLADMGMVQAFIADSEIDLAASRSLVRSTAWELDQGRSARHETSIAKTFVAEAVNRIVDRSVQVCGALGVSGDALLARYLMEVRPFRIYDGPSETHRWSIARRAVRRATSS